MIVEQLSVFLENDVGKILELTAFLAKNEINIESLYVAETEQYGVVRMLVSDPERAKELLKKDDFSASLTKVIKIVLPDSIGILEQVLQKLKQNGLNIEYIYVFSSGGLANLVLRLDEYEQADKLLDD